MLTEGASQKPRSNGISLETNATYPSGSRAAVINNSQNGQLSLPGPNAAVDFDLIHRHGVTTPLTSSSKKSRQEGIDTSYLVGPDISTLTQDESFDGILTDYTLDKDHVRAPKRKAEKSNS